jgi:hypothetical protein
MTDITEPTGPIDPRFIRQATALDLIEQRDTEEYALSVAEMAHKRMMSADAMKLVQEVVDNLETEPQSFVQANMALAMEDPLERPNFLQRTDGVHVFYPGLNVLFGEPESAKSWIAQYGVHWASQNGWKTVYLDWEKRARSVGDRLITKLDIDADYIYDLERFWYSSLSQRPTEADWEAIETAMLAWSASAGNEEGAKTYVVVDGVQTAITAHGFDPDKTFAAITFKLEFVQRLVSILPKSVFVYIDHSNMSDAMEARKASGNTQKLAWVTGVQYKVVIRDRPRPGGTGSVDMYVAKDNEGMILEHSVPAPTGVAGLDAFGTFILDSSGVDAGEPTVCEIQAPSSHPIKSELAKEIEGSDPRPVATMEVITEVLAAMKDQEEARAPMSLGAIYAAVNEYARKHRGRDGKKLPTRKQDVMDGVKHLADTGHFAKVAAEHQSRTAVKYAWKGEKYSRNDDPVAIEYALEDAESSKSANDAAAEWALSQNRGKPIVADGVTIDSQTGEVLS